MHVVVVVERVEKIHDLFALLWQRQPSKFVVFLVRANPCPDEHLTVEPCDGAVAVAHARRPFAVAVRTEPQRGMSRIVLPEPEIFSGQRLCFSGQGVVALPKFRRGFGFHREAGAAFFGVWRFPPVRA